MYMYIIVLLSTTAIIVLFVLHTVITSVFSMIPYMPCVHDVLVFTLVTNLHRIR